MRAAAALGLLVMISGCAAVPAATVGAVAGFGASALKLDDDLFDWWLSQSGVAAAPPPAACPAPPGQQ